MEKDQVLAYLEESRKTEEKELLEATILGSFISQNMRIVLITKEEKVVRDLEQKGVEALQWPPYMGSAGQNKRKELGNWIAFVVNTGDKGAILTTWIVPINDLES